MSHREPPSLCSNLSQASPHCRNTPHAAAPAAQPLASSPLREIGVDVSQARFWTAIYLYRVDSRTISRRLLVGAQTLAHSGNDLRDCGAFKNSFSISVAGGGPCAARAYCLRELCKRSE